MGIFSIDLDDSGIEIASDVRRIEITFGLRFYFDARPWA
jgi:hypothetical protein